MKAMLMSFLKKALFAEGARKLAKLKEKQRIKDLQDFGGDIWGLVDQDEHAKENNQDLVDAEFYKRYRAMDNKAKSRVRLIVESIPFSSQ